MTSSGIIAMLHVNPSLIDCFNNFYLFSIDSRYESLVVYKKYEDNI